MNWFGFGKKKSKPDADASKAAAEEQSAETPVAEPAVRTPDPVEDTPAPVAGPVQGDAVTPVPDPAMEPPEPRELPAAHVPSPLPASPAPRKPEGFFKRLSSGLSKSSAQLSGVFTKRKLDSEALDELEELLIAADLGAATAAKVIDRLSRDRFDKDVTDIEIRQALADVITETLQPYQAPLDISGPAPQVLLFVGVNGSGKTTTLGKLAVKMTREGAKLITAAGDTFRAAAVEQLQVWSDRAGAQFISRPHGADAAGLAYDAVQEGRRNGADAVLIDTAGRLQNKAELMEELRKILRVISKVDAAAPHHVVLVLDGTVGSNAISQAEAFMEAAKVTGIVMTKLDGTAKGGALVQVAEKFGLPIHFIGVGEGEDDLQPFIARDFARALAGLDA